MTWGYITINKEKYSQWWTVCIVLKCDCIEIPGTVALVIK